MTTSPTLKAGWARPKTWRPFGDLHRLVRQSIIAKQQTCFLWTSETRSLNPANYRVIAKKSRLFVDCLEDIIRQGAAAGLFREPDIEGTVFAIWGLLSSPLMWLYPAQCSNADEIIDLFTRLTFRCLAVEPMDHARCVRMPAANVSTRLSLCCWSPKRKLLMRPARYPHGRE